MDDPHVPPASEHTPVYQPIAPSVPTQNKNHLLTWILGTLTIFLATGFIIFYAGTYMSLNNELDQLENTKGKASQSALIATPTPDPTANWKVYKSTVKEISLKYPPYYLPSNQTSFETQLDGQLAIERCESNNPQWPRDCNSFPSGVAIKEENFGTQQAAINARDSEYNQPITSCLIDEKSLKRDTIQVNKQTAYRVSYQITPTSYQDCKTAPPDFRIGKFEYLYITVGLRNYKLSLYYFDENPEKEAKIKQELYQIISTIQFMQPAPVSPTSSAGTVCTQEAKLCPDGSSVGRTGPNCEFAACPPSGSQTTQPSPTLAMPAPSSTCTPRPACLNATPPCKIAITEDMCPY